MNCSAEIILDKASLGDKSPGTFPKRTCLLLPGNISLVLVSPLPEVISMCSPFPSKSSFQGPLSLLAKEAADALVSPCSPGAAVGHGAWPLSSRRWAQSSVISLGTAPCPRGGHTESRPTGGLPWNLLIGGGRLGFFFFFPGLKSLRVYVWSYQGHFFFFPKRWKEIL